MGISNYVPSSRVSQAGVCTSTTRPASPYEGQMIYETDTDKILVYNGSAWYANWNQAWGVVALSNVTSNYSIVNGEGTFTSLTFTAVANRYYKISWFAGEITNVNASVNTFRIRETSTTGTIIGEAIMYTVAGDQQPFFMSLIKTLSAGSQTVYARANNNAATATTLTASATKPAYFVVEDVGPA